MLFPKTLTETMGRIIFALYRLPFKFRSVFAFESVFKVNRFYIMWTC